MPSPGDLIEISRGVFQHWAVYVGDGYVVHMVNLGSSSSGSSGSSGSQTKSQKGKGKVKKQKLSDVVQGDKWEVNNKLDKEYTPRPAQEIVNQALSMVGDDEEYNLLDWNCEHFVKWLRYGKSYSSQVEVGATAIASTMVGTAGLVLGPIGAALGAGIGAGVMKLGIAIGKLFT